ncbi:ead/Ea22-like family protein [Pseudomonas nicosulfuronedens]
MTDLTKLKELAELATPGPWSAIWEEGDDTAWPNLFPIIQADSGETVIGNEGFYSDLEQDKANAQFCAAANPQAILGLIAEIAGIKAETEFWNAAAISHLEEVDRLKAENAALRKDAERYRWLRFLPRGNRHGGMTIMLAKDRPSPNQWCGDTIREEALDAAIDAALEGGGR